MVLLIENLWQDTTARIKGFLFSSCNHFVMEKKFKAYIVHALFDCKILSLEIIVLLISSNNLLYLLIL